MGQGLLSVGAVLNFFPLPPARNRTNPPRFSPPRFSSACSPSPFLPVRCVLISDSEHFQGPFRRKTYISPPTARHRRKITPNERRSVRPQPARKPTYPHEGVSNGALCSPCELPSTDGTRFNQKQLDRAIHGDLKLPTQFFAKIGGTRKGAARAIFTARHK